MTPTGHTRSNSRTGCSSDTNVTNWNRYWLDPLTTMNAQLASCSGTRACWCASLHSAFGVPVIRMLSLLDEDAMEQLCIWQNCTLFFSLYFGFHLAPLPQTHWNL